MRLNNNVFSQGQALIESLIVLPLLILFFACFSIFMFFSFQYANNLNDLRLEVFYASYSNHFSGFSEQEQSHILLQGEREVKFSSYQEGLNWNNGDLEALVKGWFSQGDRWVKASVMGHWSGLKKMSFLIFSQNFELHSLLSDTLVGSFKEIHQKIDQHGLAWKNQAIISQGLVNSRFSIVSNVDRGWSFNRYWTLDWVMPWSNIVTQFFK